MTNEVQLLKQDGVDSIQLAIELFNKPREGGRQHGVLMFLNHGLELLLKAALLDRGSSIWADDDGQTIGFDTCVNRAVYGSRDAEDVKFLDPEDRDPLRIINGLRDEAVHYVLDLSENQFYVHAKTGVTMADKILNDAFDERLADYMPERVLPLSTQPPKDLETLIDSEYDQIRELVEAGAVGRAGAKARSIEAIERALDEDIDSPTKAEVDDILEDIEEGQDWTEVFPGVASLNFAAEGEGPTMKFKLTRSEGTPVRVIPEEEVEGDEPVIAEREVNPFDKYSLGVKKLATHLELNWMETWAVIRDLDIHGDEQYHKEVQVSDSYEQDRYTPATIDLIEDAVENDDVDPQTALDEHWG
jgi:hypothetical protein